MPGSEPAAAQLAPMGPLISAHQGSCGASGLGLAESYRRAIDLGVDFVEFDIRRTADGAYVVHHDPFLAGGERISTLGLDEYRRAAGDKALTVAELLELARGGVGLHADLKKAGDEAATLDLLLGGSEPGRLVVTTGVDASVRRLKELRPDLRVGLSLGRSTRGLPPWEATRVRMGELFPGARIRACGPDFLSANERLARATLLRYGATHSLPIWVWTVNQEASIRRFAGDPRVSVLITDRPDLALAARAGS
jgi:glycerophosphoryl diester phosphodiesterase